MNKIANIGVFWPTWITTKSKTPSTPPKLAVVQLAVGCGWTLRWGRVTPAGEEDRLAAWEGAECDGPGGELDHDKPPYGEGESQPDGNGVDPAAEALVEQHETAPTVRILKKIKSDFTINQNFRINNHN